MTMQVDDDGNWYDDGTVDDYSQFYDSTGTVDDGSDADMAAGMIPEAELKTLTGGKTYSEFMSGAMTPEAKTAIEGLIKSYGTGAWNTAKKLFTKPDGTLNLQALGGIGGGILGAIGALQPSVQKVGYQGGLPSYQAQRTMQNAPVAGLRAGAGGTNYGGDVTYSPKGEATAAPAAPVQTVQPVTAPSVNPWAGKMARAFEPAPVAKAASPAGINTVMSPAEVLTAQQNLLTQPVTAAQGGLMNYARGGSTGRYLQGETDGMADELQTSIDGKQPAALSHGEFVVPADVVSHLGNGNSDAGAKKLYNMMDKIRQARTGTKKQGKQINPDKFMPGGLAAAYAAGGAVSKFADGGLTNVPSGTTGVEQTTAGWTGNYIPNMLGQTQALTATPYQAYGGPLTAGASDLQQQAFTGASENVQGGYTPTTFTGGTFGTQEAQQYMNPYLQASLNPQIAAARRQSDITAQQNAGAMTKAGAFGGGRQAILAAENQRNLGTTLADITGKGYSTAYDKAMAQFNAEQNRGLDTQRAAEQSRQYGADYGIKALSQLGEMGATQRGIESEGVAADKAAFEAARDNPYNQLKFQSQMLSGLPIQATNYNTALPSTAQQTLAGAGGVAGLFGNKTTMTADDVTSLLRNLGFTL